MLEANGIEPNLLQEAINEEIARGFQYNFRMHLPYDNDDQPSLRGYRACHRLIGIWDTKYGDWLKQKGEATEGHSKLRLNQTSNEFYDVFDSVLSEFGIEIEDARNYSRPEDEGGMISEERRLFVKRLEPVYRHLRLTGYTHDELTS